MDRVSPDASLVAQPALIAKADPLAAEVAGLNARFRGATPEAVLAAIVRERPGKVAMLSSFGAEAGAALAVVAEVAPDLPVLFLDTGMHFFQTLQYRRQLAERLGLTGVRDVKTAANDPRDPKSDMWKSDPDACCGFRKVEPLARASAGFEVLVTGRKRFHGAGRVRLPLFEAINGQLRLNLLVSLTPEEVKTRFSRLDLPRHPLVEQGYASIGCWPCTRPAETGDADVRAGRWAGSEKVECGIHLARTTSA